MWKSSILTLWSFLILGRTQVQTVQVLFTIYIHVEGNPGFHRSRKRKVQEKWRFSHTHTPRFYTANHSCPKQQVGHRSREKCLAQSSSDERICVLALNGKHNSSVMGDRCVKPTVSSAQSEWRGKESKTINTCGLVGPARQTQGPRQITLITLPCYR